MLSLSNFKKMYLNINDFYKRADIVHETDAKTVVLSLSSLGNFDAF